MESAEVVHSLHALLDAFLPACSVPSQSPRVAVAVSGGPDSMALALLVHHWVQQRGGRCIALTVDHCLRAESSWEAQKVAVWMRDCGIVHEILTPENPPPSGAGQAWARQCRYSLLEEWCRGAGIVHVLLAHHRRDQEETLLIRQESGSGRLGLSGMPAVSTKDYVRLLRPFLEVSPNDLRVFLKAKNQQWIEDPSNKDSRYARGRLRSGIAGGACAEAITTSRKPVVQPFSPQDRFVFEKGVDALLAQTAVISHFGFAHLDVDRLQRAPLDVSVCCMRRVLACIGGLEYLPSEKKSQDVLVGLFSCSSRRGYSLGRCLVRPCGGGALVVREERGMLSRNMDSFQREFLWDGRFLVTKKQVDPCAFMVSPLGGRGVEVVQSSGAFSDLWSSIPKLVWPTLPALWKGKVLAYVPYVGYVSEEARVSLATAPIIRFAPYHSLGSCTFRLAVGAINPM